jgi:hypothetical protein
VVLSVRAPLWIVTGADSNHFCKKPHARGIVVGNQPPSSAGLLRFGPHTGAAKRGPDVAGNIAHGATSPIHLAAGIPLAAGIHGYARRD